MSYRYHRMKEKDGGMIRRIFDRVRGVDNLAQIAPLDIQQEPIIELKEPFYTDAERRLDIPMRDHKKLTEFTTTIQSLNFLIADNEIFESLKLLINGEDAEEGEGRDFVYPSKKTFKIYKKIKRVIDEIKKEYDLDYIEKLYESVYPDWEGLKVAIDYYKSILGEFEPFLDLGLEKIERDRDLGFNY